ncbi:MAG: hypothetical protein Kow0077_12780 [Anaerolineae bacterium]
MNIFLEPQEDGLPMRESGQWAQKKLSVLAHYIATSTVAMKSKPWRRRFYIDLQAGPGKNFIKNSKRVFLGSPLLAITEGAGFTDYFFVEQDSNLAEALSQRCASLPADIQKKIQILVGDCNEKVTEITKHIQQIDQPPYSPTNWNSLSLAFLDPEGLELNWESVKLLASLKRVDLIINFSIGGLRRSAENALKMEPGNTQVDRFFGTQEWRTIPKRPSGKMPSNEWIDFYCGRLKQLGYESWGTPISVKNSKRAELYRLLFASKHELGAKLWEEARKRGPTQRPLF